MSVDVPGYTPKREGDDIADFNFISPDYFKTIGQRLIRGRDFGERDNTSGPRVAIVNEKFIQHYLGGKDPIGQQFRQGGDVIEIIGTVANARDRGVRGGPETAVYIPEKQGQTSGLTLLVRTANKPKTIIPSLLAIVKSIDRRMPVYSVHTLSTEVEAGFSSERILGYLSGLFAGLTALLAGIGLYGVIAYSVVQRTREIGVRFAVGAQRRDVAGLFARESLVLVLVGLAIGGPIAFGSVRALRSLLFGVTTTDLPTLFLSMSVLVIAALLAITLPLLRAARINPVVALQHE